MNALLPGEPLNESPDRLTAGRDRPPAVEILSAEHRHLPIREGLARARAATLQALDAAEALVASSG